MRKAGSVECPEGRSPCVRSASIQYQQWWNRRDQDEPSAPSIMDSPNVLPLSSLPPRPSCPAASSIPVSEDTLQAEPIPPSKLPLQLITNQDFTLHNLHSPPERDSIHHTPPATDDKPMSSTTTLGLTARGPFSNTEVIERDMLNKRKPQYPSPPHSLPPHRSCTQAMANRDHSSLQGDSMVPRGAYSQQQHGSYKSLSGNGAPSLPPGNVHSSNSSQPLPMPPVPTQPSPQPVPMGTGQDRVGSGLGHAALAPPTVGPDIHSQRFHAHQPPYPAHYSGGCEGEANWRLEERTHLGYPYTHHPLPPQRAAPQQTRVAGHMGTTRQNQGHPPYHYMGSQPEVQGTGMGGRPCYPLPSHSHYQTPQGGYSPQYYPVSHTTAPYYHYPSSSSSFPSSTMAYTSTSLSSGGSSGSDPRFGPGPQSSIPYAPLSSYYSANTSSPHSATPQSDLMYNRKSNGAPLLNPQYAWGPTPHPLTPQEGNTPLSYSGHSNPAPPALPTTHRQTPSPTHGEEKTYHAYPYPAFSGESLHPEGEDSLSKSLKNMQFEDDEPNTIPQHERTPAASAPVEILEQPQDCEVDSNGRAEFSCRARLAFSDGEPHYLWYKNGEPLVGEISNQCVVEEVTEADVGHYFCLVSDPLEENCVKTQRAELRLRQGKATKAPRLNQQPEAYVEIAKGQPLQLTIVADGATPMHYKWFKGTRELEYCTDRVLSVSSASPTDSGQYCCAVSNDYGSVLSDIVQVKVVHQQSPLPPITPYAQPSAHTRHQPRQYNNPDAQVPSDHLLRQFARPVAQQTTNWGRLALFLGLMPTDATNSQLFQASPQERAYHLLRQWRQRQCGTTHALKTILTEAGVVLNVPPPPSSSSSPATSPSISLQPQSVTVVYGQEARLEVKAETADPSTSYQWYKNGHPLSGKTHKQLVIASTVDSDQGSYSCRVSNSAGSVLSHSAIIRVVSVHPQPHEVKHQLPRSHDMKQHYWAEHSGLPQLTSRGVGSDTEVRPRPEPPSVQASSVAPPHEVVEKFHISQHPRSQEVSLGSPATLSCRASGPGHLSYLWYLNGLSLPEDNTPDYHIESVTEDDEGLYSCEVFCQASSLMSNMARLSLKK